MTNSPLVQFGLMIDTDNKLDGFIKWTKSKGLSLCLTNKQHKFLSMLVNKWDMVPISPKTKEIVSLLITYKNIIEENNGQD